jgi:hypothetical protein
MGATTQDKVSKVFDVNFAPRGLKSRSADQTTSAPPFDIASRAFTQRFISA